MSKIEQANQYIDKNKVPKEEKPVFHVTPVVGWLNDPNGFSAYQGEIHLFYQYHPYGNVWGPMHWGHCKTKDFIRWEELPVALAPDQDYDAAGCFSGSAIETKDGHALVYTGVIETEMEDGSKQVRQNQCLALGDGRNYTKVSNNPVIQGYQLPDGFNLADFRDPKIWKENDTYYLVVGNKTSKQEGQIVLFQSSDLLNWDYVSVLAENTMNAYGVMWECPDFFELDGTHVLVVSPQDMRAKGYEFHNGNNAIYFAGKYDKVTHTFEKGDPKSIDYGLDFYAPQTTLTKDGRRIMIGWMQSWDTNFKPMNQRWMGMMTIPRELEMVDGCLIQNPVRELDNYHTEQVKYENQVIEGECQLPGISGRVLDMTVELLEGDYSKFTIQLAHNEEYTTSFSIDATSGICEFDRTYSGMIRDVVCQRKLKLNGTKSNVKLRFVMDKYSVEIFINDGMQAFSATLYTPLEADEIVFQCDGKVVANIEKYDICI